jgi:plasmid maintenance system antidote protein VapI
MAKPYFSLESIRHFTFCDVQSRLISFVVTKIRNGEYTERRLARILGVSQPQLHNVLKGARPLKPEFADVLLRQFEIGILDLVSAAEIATHLKTHEARQMHLWLDLTPEKETALPPRRTVGKESGSKSYLRRIAG